MNYFGLDFETLQEYSQIIILTIETTKKESILEADWWGDPLDSGTLCPTLQFISQQHARQYIFCPSSYPLNYFCRKMIFTPDQPVSNRASGEISC